ncbi:efflux RND transporter periplasmic adaptor subunit [Flavobacterium sp. RHBU_3]|uniref:efflux RND transporter periplasmic adaptor subunit n=1 Tax=Flavobacterium sp. RHBU_3 TaxID=3391184 RepID=UPI0039855260
MKNKILLLTGLCIVAGLIAFKLVANKQKIEEKEKPTNTANVRIPVTTATVSEKVQEIKLAKTGRFTPYNEATVVATGSANIKRLFFSLGDKVKKGQVLAELDTSLLELELQKSESTVLKLKNDLKTYTELLEGNAATRETVDEIRQNYSDAMNLSGQLKRQIANAVIKAPVRGIIETKKAEEGVFIAAGAEITTIVNLEKIKVSINLTEQEVYQVNLNQKVTLTTDVYPGAVLSGNINFISPRANGANNYTVEISAPNNAATPLKAGTFVTVSLSHKTLKKIALIPRAALLQGTQNASVYIAENGRARQLKIKIGRTFGEQIEVTGGLTTGSRVIISGQINLHNGSPIQIINN